jgi:hypothetical protein
LNFSFASFLLVQAKRKEGVTQGSAKQKESRDEGSSENRVKKPYITRIIPEKYRKIAPRFEDYGFPIH